MRNESSVSIPPISVRCVRAVSVGHAHDRIMDTQVWVGSEEPTADRVDPIKNSDDGPPKKPKGGLWTSTLKTTEGDEVSSGWIEWMKAEGWCNVKEPQAWVLEPKDDVDVYVIDSVEDAIDIMVPDERYRSMSLQEYRIDWAEVFGIRDYDAIRLTEKGQWETRFPNKCYHENGERKWGKHSDNLRGYSLYGWDCECVLWEGWQFTDVEYAGEVTIPKHEY